MSMHYISKVSLSLVCEDTQEEQISIATPQDVFQADFVQRELINADREKFVILHLNCRHVVIAYDVVAIGTLGYAPVHMREVFKAAIKNNAHTIIATHNHPSGDTEPSTEDLTLTRRLVDSGKLLGIEVLDSLILSYRGCYSLKEHGFI